MTRRTAAQQTLPEVTAPTPRQKKRADGQTEAGEQRLIDFVVRELLWDRLLCGKLAVFGFLLLFWCLACLLAFVGRLGALSPPRPGNPE